jgi:2-polyprenyl-3-methyl-5-hydroxy-6-metoxy-1,4-benzoquinol methylase
MDRLYRIARSYTLKWKQQLIASSAQEKTLLDYGCGTGSFLTHMKSKGWHVTGVEPSPDARAKASEHDTVYENMEGADGRYSIITLWHVLEHIHDLNKILIELGKRLEASGTIFIAVPNYKSADATHYKNHWAAYDVPRHLWHFDRQTMTQVLANAGLKVQKILPMTLDAYYVCLLSESYKDPNASTITKYFRALQQASNSNRAARNSGEYSSLIYIAKKS